MGGSHSTVQIAELEDASGWAPIRLRLGVRAFGINTWTAHEAGKIVIVHHDERQSGHEELYFVVSGTAIFTIDGDEIEARTGTVVFVRDPAATRSAVARDAETTVLAVGGEPNDVHRPQAWEANASVGPLFARGEHAEARRVLSEALERYEERSRIHYNLACIEAQLGNTDAAVEHLRTALAGRPSLAESAHEDPDLAPLRDDPRFTTVTALVPAAGDTA